MDDRATVVMARAAPLRSIERIRAAAVDLRLTEDMRSAFVLLQELVDEGMTLVHPFDDPIVVAGQATVGLELADDAPHLTGVLVRIGGGALVTAAAAVALKASLPNVRVWGVETEGADAMRRTGDLLLVMRAVETATHPLVRKAAHRPASPVVTG